MEDSHSYLWQSSLRGRRLCRSYALDDASKRRSTQNIMKHSGNTSWTAAANCSTEASRVADIARLAPDTGVNEA